MIYFFPLPKEITRDFLLRLPPELFKELEREAKVQRSSRTKLVRKALTEYLNGKQLDRDLERDLRSERAKEAARVATQK
jgi:metal-responsive CopG/Arc/MetJ family transcriptional regulator